MGERPAKLSSEAISTKPRFILIGLALSALALMPFSYQLASKRVSYIETEHSLKLHPGLNRLGNVSLTLGPDGKLLHAEKTERWIVDNFFGFPNMKGFFLTVAPFFSMLSLCFFLFWYEAQQKNRYVVFLKNYTLGLFFLVSLWFSCWTFIPEVDPSYQGFYQSGTCIALSVVEIAFYYLYRYCGRKIHLVQSKASVLLLHVFEVRKRHYPRMALKAMDSMEELEETHMQIQEYDKRTLWVVDKAKGFIRGRELEKPYRDYKRFVIDP